MRTGPGTCRTDNLCPVGTVLRTWDTGCQKRPRHAERIGLTRRINICNPDPIGKCQSLGKTVKQCTRARIGMRLKYNADPSRSHAPYSGH